ncbi:fasciclin domain-containing protein [Brevundimonas sp. DC300-4]|uniref:fasciclin domain-containing protein n=1 Tax=Brevundimonas sp. DC300-4 TaxID=2804594 RepID=UPI003CE758D2
MSNQRLWALAPLMVLCLAGCGRDADKAGPDGVAAPSNQTLAAAIADEGDLDTLEGVVSNGGLSEVLEGKGPYTVFAPVNAALGTAGSELAGEAMKAQSAALLRAHIVPGALTRADIEAALARGGADGVQMRTMSDGLLTFSKDGDVIVVTAADGATARLTGAETVVSNGAVQPVDGVLVKAE